MFESAHSVIILFNMFGAGVGAVLSTTLLSLPSIPSNSVRWMGAVLLCVSAAMICISLEHAGYLAGLPITFVEYLCAVAFGPIIHVYVLVTTGDRRTKAFWISAGVLGVAALATNSIQVMMVYQIAFTFLSVIVYLRRSSECNPEDVYWTVRLLAAAIVLHIAQVVRLGVGVSNTPLREIVPLTATIGVIGLCCVALRRSFNFRPEPAPVKYQRSQLSGPDAAEHLLRLDQAMQTRKLYRRSDLTLAGLAEAIDVTPHHLSQILNQHAGQTFSEYLNRLRVREVQDQLADASNDRFTIEAIGQEAGFKSRSAFYAAFRKVTGMSPAEFRQKVCPVRSDRTNLR